MTVAQDRGAYGEPPARLQADQSAEFHVAAPHPGAVFVKVVDADGSIHLLPWETLDDAEKAMLRDARLREETLEALDAFQSGEGVSSDWLFDSDE
ncbi:hypothetical protein MNAB215_738 [Mycobacterium numidiamassiliense]|jgi:hypothetical protein|uniref:Uncharacterized protein n=1 Tax=Mycobacterium numidiamassiliense TaxID=1841861 RepID=A0A2U3P477_9MYCO|nr:hypothetical protein [Mycobacterium numidiamassiliense]SPM38561.1 hypothetical protein MNAB215_738 [Mycobacterium numidiamassiliense]